MKRKLIWRVLALTLAALLACAGAAGYATQDTLTGDNVKFTNNADGSASVVLGNGGGTTVTFDLTNANLSEDSQLNGFALDFDSDTALVLTCSTETLTNADLRERDTNMNAEMQNYIHLNIITNGMSYIINHANEFSSNYMNALANGTDGGTDDTPKDKSHVDPDEPSTPSEPDAVKKEIAPHNFDSADVDNIFVYDISASKFSFQYEQGILTRQQGTLTRQEAAQFLFTFITDETNDSPKYEKDVIMVLGDFAGAKVEVGNASTLVNLAMNINLSVNVGCQIIDLNPPEDAGFICYECGKPLSLSDVAMNIKAPLACNAHNLCEECYVGSVVDVHLNLLNCGEKHYSCMNATHYCDPANGGCAGFYSCDSTAHSVCKMCELRWCDSTNGSHKTPDCGNDKHRECYCVSNNIEYVASEHRKCDQCDLFTCDGHTHEIVIICPACKQRVESASMHLMRCGHYDCKIESYSDHAPCEMCKQPLCAGEHGEDRCVCGGCGSTGTIHARQTCGHYQCQMAPDSDHSVCGGAAGCGGYRCDGNSHAGLPCDHCQQAEGEHTRCSLCDAFLCNGGVHGEGACDIAQNEPDK